METPVIGLLQRSSVGKLTLDTKVDTPPELKPPAAKLATEISDMEEPEDAFDDQLVKIHALTC